jgi:hypothetical protein
MTGNEWMDAAVALVLTLAAALVVVLVWRRWKALRGGHRLELARKRFHWQREWLEARFLTLASQSGKPRGLAWSDCNFDDDVAFARDRNSGQLRALVGVTISFQAVAGGGLEDNENVGNLRSATAVFRLDGAEWSTDGRAIFNLSPAQTIQHFHHELETMD